MYELEGKILHFNVRPLLISIWWMYFLFSRFYGIGNGLSKHPTENQLEIGEEASQAHILISDLISNGDVHN